MDFQENFLYSRSLASLSIFLWFVPILFCLILIIATKYPQSVLNRLVSSFINAYLLFRYPITSEDRQNSIPTCPYRWPNGQGDDGKFLNGENNGEVWRRKYGRVYRVWSGMRPEIVLTQPEDIQTVFADSDKHIKAVNNDSGWLMSELLGKCVGLVSKDSWKTLRTVTEVPFLRHTVSVNVPFIERQTQSHFDGLHANGRLGQEILNPVEDLKMLPFWIVASILYGDLTPDMKHLLQELVPLRESLFQRVISGGLIRFSWSSHLHLFVVSDLVHFKNKWAQFNDLALQNAQHTSLSAPIIEYYKAVQTGQISREEMLQTIDEMLFANLDVTMGGISWVLMFLAANPSEQSNLRREITQTLSAAGDDARKRYYLSNTTLLAASITESARLKPLAAFSIPQAAPTDRVIGGFRVPAGTNFIVDTYALNTLNAFWGSDGKQYRPSRFFERSATKYRYNFWRFGFGPRICMGKNVADLIMRVLVVYLLEHYELALIEGETSWRKNETTWITHPDTVLGCRALGGPGLEGK